MVWKIVAISALRIAIVALVAMVAVSLSNGLRYLAPLPVATPSFRMVYCFAILGILSLGAVRNLRNQRWTIFITPLAIELAAIWFLSWYGLKGQPSWIIDLIWGDFYSSRSARFPSTLRTAIANVSVVSWLLCVTIGFLNMMRTFRPPRDVCPHCRYQLRGLTGVRCPECGAAIDAKNIPTVESAT